MNKLNYEICTLLKTNIKNSNLTCNELATLMNISETSLKQYLSHHRPFPMAKVMELAENLSLSLSQLIEQAELRC